MTKAYTVILTLAALGATACNSARKQECEKFLSAMKPLDEGKPTTDLVDHVQAEVAAFAFEDQPLGVYAKNYGNRLTVLSNTLKLQASPSAPDGTGDVVNQTLKDARTDRDDVQRYCSQ